MNITLYGIPGCGMCAALSQMLDNKKIKYLKVVSVDECAKLGFSSVPVLDVDGKRMTFGEAIAWINSMDEAQENDFCPTCRVGGQDD